MGGTQGNGKGERFYFWRVTVRAAAIWEEGLEANIATDHIQVE
jgi:hypothetical protein